MPKFIATYDLEETEPDPHSSFLDNAELMGWKLWILGGRSGLWKRLPNTTLIGEFPNAEEAKTAFRAIKGATQNSIAGRVNVEKYIIAEFTVASFDSDVSETGDYPRR